MMARKPIVIKKYENRRLYDTTNSRYINQDEVANLIRDGHEVQVLDAATGEDLTRLVLTQIIVEDAKGRDSTFPLDILRQMVVASGKATKENTLQYMKSVLGMYQNAFRALSPVVNPLEFLHAQAHTPGEDTGEATPPQESEARRASELQQRVEELEAMMAKMAGAKATSRKKAPKPASKSRRKR
jgi:polyhydroxyalkanoate synthesis repressor PhaR